MKTCSISFSSSIARCPSLDHWISRSKNSLQALVYEVIDIESDEDSAIIEKELNKLKKGKAVMDVSDGHLNGYSKVQQLLL